MSIFKGQLFGNTWQFEAYLLLIDQLYIIQFKVEKILTCGN
jgi:hypothetical protein